MTSRPRTSCRRWSDIFKKRVVAEASQPGMTVAQIAHRYDLDARRISNWKTKFGSGEILVPVEVTPDDDNVSMSAQQSHSCMTRGCIAPCDAIFDHVRGMCMAPDLLGTVRCCGRGRRITTTRNCF